METNEQGWELERVKEDKNIVNGLEKHEIHFRKFNYKELTGDECAVKNCTEYKF